MRTNDLTDNERKSLDDVAHLLYQDKRGGRAAIYALAKLLGWEEYGPCDPCEDRAPMLDSCCLICGTRAPKEATP